MRGRHARRRPPDGERHLPAHGRAGADRHRRVGRRRLRGLLRRTRGPDPDAARHRRPRIPARCGQRRRHVDDQCVRLVAVGLERLHGRGDRCARNSTLGAGGGGYSLEWPANPGQPPATGLDTTPCGLSTCRAVPDFSYPSDPVGRRSRRLLERPLDRLRRHQCRRAHQRRALRRHQPGLLQPARPGRPRALCGATGQWRHLHRHHAGQQRLHRHQPRGSSPPPPASMPPAASAHPSTRT